MRAYLITTGSLFLLIILAHVARVILEGTDRITEPVFLVSTLVCVLLAAWAIRLLTSGPGRGRE